MSSPIMNVKDPVKRFFAFMRERESVRLKKLAGKSWPWTEDKILQTYSFTNVKREHDRTSQLLIKHLYHPNYGAPRYQLLLNCALARYIGTAEFMQALRWQDSFRPKYIKDLIQSRMYKKEKVWTGAYIIPSGGYSGNKSDIVIDYFIKGLWEARDELCKRFDTWREFVETLIQVEGYGGSGFMAKELTLDTFYTSFWSKPPKDKNTWTPVGPGSMRGAARIKGDEQANRLVKNKTLKVCLELFEIHDLYWPKDYVELELTDIQFQLCEFDKWERVRLCQGRPRKTYTPRQGRLF